MAANTVARGVAMGAFAKYADIAILSVRTLLLRVRHNAKKIVKSFKRFSKGVKVVGRQVNLLCLLNSVEKYNWIS
jgi:hypothetical protein